MGTPDHTESRFDHRFGARPDHQSINQIEQYRALDRESLRDSFVQLLYTFHQGAFFSPHSSSLTLEKRLRGGQRPMILSKLVQIVNG